LDPKRITALAVLLAIAASIALMFIHPQPAISVAWQDNASNTVPVEQEENSPPPVSSEQCLLKVYGDRGVQEIRVSGNKTCPASYVVEITVKRGYRLKSARIGGHEYNSTRFTVSLTDNATLAVSTERLYVTIRVLVNASAPYLLNGTEHRGNATLRVPLGARMNLTLLPGRRGSFDLVPLNASAMLVASGNATVRLYWLQRCRGVLVKSNVPVPLLPACHKPPIVLSYGLAGPTINATHRYWLAWYWVREGNRTWWWSPGINGTKLHIERPANVTLHYIPGLKTLPYVERVYQWPEAHVKYAGLRVWVEDGWAKAKANLTYQFFYLNGTKYGGPVYYYVLVLQAPPDVSLVKVEAYVPSGSGHFFFVPLAWGNFSAGLLVCGKGFLYVSNETRYDLDRLDADYEARGYSFLDVWPPYLRFHRSVPTRFSILVNFTALREAWSRGLCDMPLRKIFPGSNIRGRFSDSPISGNMNPVKGVYPDSAFIVYRWPSGDNLLVFIYLLLKGYGSPAPYIAARITGVAP